MPLKSLVIDEQWWEGITCMVINAKVIVDWTTLWTATKGINSVDGIVSLWWNDIPIYKFVYVDLHIDHLYIWENTYWLHLLFRCVSYINGYTLSTIHAWFTMTCRSLTLNIWPTGFITTKYGVFIIDVVETLTMHIGWPVSVTRYHIS